MIMNTMNFFFLFLVDKPPAKKLAKVTPRKENRPLVRKPTAAMGTSQRFPSARSPTYVKIPPRIKSSKVRN